MPEEATLRVSDDRTPPAAEIAQGTYRPGFLAAIDACLKVRHAERPQSVASCGRCCLRRARRRSPSPSPNRNPSPNHASKRPPSARPGGGRWPSSQSSWFWAALMAVTNSLAGRQRSLFRPLRRSVSNPSRKRGDRRTLPRPRRGPTRTRQPRLEPRPGARPSLASRKRGGRRTLLWPRRRPTRTRQPEFKPKPSARPRNDEQDARRQADARRGQKKADEDEAARVQAEATRKAELAEQERRRREASLGTASFDGVWEITRVGTNCFAQSHVFGVTIENGTFAQGFGTVSASGEFKIPGAVPEYRSRRLDYTGKLSGRSGSGTFEADGGNCSGTFTAKRRG